jgi:hypothetical protein
VNKLKPFLKVSSPFVLLLGCAVLTLTQPVKAVIIGQMPSLNEVLYITAEPCTSESGRVEPRWYFSYSVNAVGTVTRSCYVRYNDQIWLKGPYGTESIFPMSNFTKPDDAGKAEAGSEVKQ